MNAVQRGELLAIARGLVDVHEDDLIPNRDMVRRLASLALTIHDRPAPPLPDRLPPREPGDVRRFDVRRKITTGRLVLVVDALRDNYDCAEERDDGYEEYVSTGSWLLATTKHVGRIPWHPEYLAMNDDAIVRDLFVTGRLRASVAEQERDAAPTPSRPTAEAGEAHVVVTGNLTCGFRVYGPFPTFDDAVVSPHGKEPDAWVMTLHGPNADP